MELVEREQVRPLRAGPEPRIHADWWAGRDEFGPLPRAGGVELFKKLDPQPRSGQVLHLRAILENARTAAVLLDLAAIDMKQKITTRRCRSRAAAWPSSGR